MSRPLVPPCLPCLEVSIRMSFSRTFVLLLTARAAKILLEMETMYRQTTIEINWLY